MVPNLIQKFFKFNFRNDSTYQYKNYIKIILGHTLYNKVLIILNFRYFYKTHFTINSKLFSKIYY